jgi:hypothetical protein
MGMRRQLAEVSITLWQLPFHNDIANAGTLTKHPLHFDYLFREVIFMTPDWSNATVEVDNSVGACHDGFADINAKTREFATDGPDKFGVRDLGVMTNTHCRGCLLLWSVTVRAERRAA